MHPRGFVVILIVATSAAPGIAQTNRDPDQAEACLRIEDFDTTGYGLLCSEALAVSTIGNSLLEAVGNPGGASSGPDPVQVRRYCGFNPCQSDDLSLCEKQEKILSSLEGVFGSVVARAEDEIYGRHNPTGGTEFDCPRLGRAMGTFVHDLTALADHARIGAGEPQIFSILRRNSLNEVTRAGYFEELWAGEQAAAVWNGLSASDRAVLAAFPPEGQAACGYMPQSVHRSEGIGRRINEMAQRAYRSASYHACPPRFEGRNFSNWSLDGNRASQ